MDRRKSDKPNRDFLVNAALFTISLTLLTIIVYAAIA